ncbi:MAG: DUF1385 domain-containing protein [Actinomycetia bacterium]|nr:DUF1385 domain-containing protein [Actinomycetes bacterium]
MKSDVKKNIPVGGQAVIDGVMMRSPNWYSVAIRKQSGEVDVKLFPIISIVKKYPIAKAPLIRGIVALIENLILGFKSLVYSVDKISIAEGREEVKISGFQMTISIIIALILAIGIFFVLPTYLGKFVYKFISNVFLYNLIEGLIRFAILLLYVIFVSLLKDIRTLFEYHGAEHKTLHAYEAGDELTYENANKYSTLHMRCGTALLMIVVFISILIFSILGEQTLIQRVIYRIVLIPLIIGISYEFIKLAGKFPESKILKIVSIPGLLFQKLTTRNPSEEQLEVAIVALEKVINREIKKEEPLIQDQDFLTPP